MGLRLTLLIFSAGIGISSIAQTPEQINNYISTYKDLAIAEMQRTGIPAAITLAQGIHETGAGTSDLVIASNNHFGIKCKSSWTGQVVYHDDDARGECFRKYASASDSYRDHSDYLSQTPRYAFLFKLNPEDYEGWAYGLKSAGYATNIKYSQILIKLINDYDLEKYSLIALGKIVPQDSVISIQTAAIPSYPDQPFSINSAKVIYVKAGVSLLSLSDQYEIPLAHLLEFNDMTQEDVLKNDQLIFLQRKRKTGANAYHIVQAGETTYIVCQMEGIRYESILEYNHMKPGDDAAPGEKLYLQADSITKPALKNNAGSKIEIPSS